MRSLLFVPADDAKKLDKAMASGADALIVDLEDSIPTQGKADARLSAAAFIADAGKAEHRPRLLVRVNGFASGLCDGDLDAVVPAGPDAIMLQYVNPMAINAWAISARFEISTITSLSRFEIPIFRRPDARRLSTRRKRRPLAYPYC